MQYQIDFLLFRLDNEVYYLANACNSAVVNVLSEIEGLAAVHDLQLAACDFADVLEFQLHIVEQQFVDLHQQVLFGLVFVQVDGPAQPQRDASALACLVEIDLHAVFELIAPVDCGLACEAVVYKTCDFDGFGQSDQNVSSPDGYHKLAVLGGDGEVVGGGGGSGGSGLSNEGDVFDDEVVLRDAFQVLVAEEDFLFLVDAEAEREYFQLSGFDFAADDSSGAQFGELEVEAEDDHAVLPALQGEAVGDAVFELEEEVVLQTGVLVVEGAGEVLFVLVREGVVGFLDAVAVQYFHAFQTDVQYFNHGNLYYRTGAAIINHQSIMSSLATFLLAALVVLAAADAFPQAGLCYHQAQQFQNAVVRALEQKDTDKIVDALELIVDSIPSMLETCGADDEAQYFREQLPPACTKLLAREAKLLIKIMRLYAEDPEKNEKAIVLYTTMFETVYRTQVQKKCPALREQHLLEVKNKGQCAEGAYQFSLVFEQLDNHLAAGKFNSSLNDVGKLMQQLPLFLDSCSQAKLAQFVRFNFPEECVDALGGIVREMVTIEHHYTHIEWLQKHLKDFTKAIAHVRATCPALEGRE